MYLFVSCNKPFALTSRRKLSQQKWRFFLYCYLLYHKSFLFKKLLIAFFWLFSVDRVENKTLALHKVTRSQMGSYLCIATNGYPPAVSKKVQLKVNCKFQFIHSVWKSTKKSHSTLRAKRATFIFWVDKSSLKMPKMVNFGEFLKTWSLRSNSVTRQDKNWKIQMRHF